MAASKLKTGVPGLDTIFKGGIREKSSVLVSGGPGTGKTILTMQFLVEGAKRKEPGLFILYDAEEGLLDYADSLGIEIRKFVKSGMIHIVQESSMIRKFSSIAVPLDIITKKRIKRVVLDSLTMFAYIHTTDDKEYRKEILNFLHSMRNITLLATTEMTESNLDDLSFKPEDFMFDGIVFLTKVRQGSSFERVLHVGKMRGQDHLINLYPFFIGKGGIKVYPDQIPFSLAQKDTAQKSN